MGGAYRPSESGQARSGDHIPTPELLDAVRAAAWDCAVAKARAMPWPPGPLAIGLIELTPALALMALVSLLPTVPIHRLASCLRVDLRDTTAAFNRAASAGPWAAEAVAAIATEIGGDFA